MTVIRDWTKEDLDAVIYAVDYQTDRFTGLGADLGSAYSDMCAEERQQEQEIAEEEEAIRRLKQEQEEAEDEAVWDAHQAQTEEQALARAREAVKNWLEKAQERRDEKPKLKAKGKKKR